MSVQVGLWIDHRKATIVAITKKGEEISEILSDVETQLRRSSDSPLKGSYEALQVPADDSRQRLPCAHKSFLSNFPHSEHRLKPFQAMG